MHRPKPYHDSIKHKIMQNKLDDLINLRWYSIKDRKLYKNIAQL